MQVTIKSNFHEVSRFMGDLRKQVRYAGAVALTRTAKDVQAAIPAQLEKDLDRPTDFTKRGTFVTPARKDTLEAYVGFKDRQARYMGLQIAGGVYNPRDSGIRLPGNIQLNAFGNIPRGTIAKLKAGAKDGSLGKALAKRINSAQTKGGPAIQLFVGKPEGKRFQNAPMGIWRREPGPSPGSPGKLVPIIVFETKKVTYKARFDFPALAQRVADTSFGPHFDQALQNALRTAK